MTAFFHHFFRLNPFPSGDPQFEAVFGPLKRYSRKSNKLGRTCDLSGQFHCHETLARKANSPPGVYLESPRGIEANGRRLYRPFGFRASRV